MGSWASLKVGDIEITSFKSEVEPWVALVFTSEDRRTRPASAEEIDERGGDDPWEVTELVAPAAVVRDRLELTGADWESAVAMFKQLVDDKLELDREMQPRFRDLPIDKEIEYLSTIDLDRWVAAVRDAPPDTPTQSRLELGSRRWLFGIWEYGDVRLCLRATIECRPDDIVCVDVTDLIDGGWLEQDEDPREVALLSFGWAERYASPIVVLTEGSTDAQILETSLAVIYPHLREFIRFADFSQRPEANAGALVRTVKAFAAAGITNRVVALFDADTAAYDAVRSLSGLPLPPSIVVRHLPSLNIAISYPTVGPEGAGTMDVNGKACSLELYLGSDVLTDADGALPPVRWTTFMPGVGAWHGVVERKAELHARFAEKAKVALRDPSQVPTQDWGVCARSWIRFDTRLLPRLGRSAPRSRTRIGR
jgi:hypothetical protein